jgi:hypothetical protein
LFVFSHARVPLDITRADALRDDASSPNAGVLRHNCDTAREFGTGAFFVIEPASELWEYG